MTPTDPRHGTTAGYHAGCRDRCCKRAMARYEKACRLDRLRGGRAVPALGAKRRLQALMRLGWSSQRIATEAGRTHRNHVWRILHGQNGKPTKWIQRGTDEWVREVYERLSMTVPVGHYVNRTRAYAERMGWPPPLAYTDIDDPSDQPAWYRGRWHTFDERYWAKVDTSGDCWKWLGALTEKGYGGRILFDGRPRYPHQIAYEMAAGPIPSGLVIDHLCRNRACVNPGHLEVVTALENTQRGVDARWVEPCPNGHSSEFRRRIPSGKNVCTACRRDSDAKRDERDKEKRRQAARARYAAGIRTRERRDLLTEWAQLQEAGESIDQAARRLGVTVSAIKKAHERAQKESAA